MNHGHESQPKRQAHKRSQRKRAAQKRSGLKLTLREKLLSLALFAVSTVSVAQIGTAQGDDLSGNVPSYDDARSLWSERAADNFPGSAFYYIAEDSDWASSRSPGHAPAMAASSDIAGGITGLAGSANIVSSIADSFRLAGTSQDRYRAQQCLTTAIYYEAALEPDAGQRAVAQVILNRVRHPSYPSSICGVVYQGSERATGCQFTFSCDGSMARRPNPFHWKRARKVAGDMLSGDVFAPVGTATHYHTTEVNPYWAPSLNFVGTIGAHRFYTWKGRAGQRAAFASLYKGAEPNPGPKPKQAIARAESTTDPVALARAYEAAVAQSNAAAAAKAGAQATNSGISGLAAKAGAPALAPTPRYSAEAKAKGGDANYRAKNLPGASTVRPEYKNSGRWIAQPGKK